MTAKKISRINRRSDYGSEYPSGNYSWFFSSDLADWMGAKTSVKRNQKERAKKEVNRRRDFHLKHG